MRWGESARWAEAALKAGAKVVDLSNDLRVPGPQTPEWARGAVYGPFVPLLRSPELMEYAQRMGEYLRYRCSLSGRLSELALERGGKAAEGRYRRRGASTMTAK